MVSEEDVLRIKDEYTRNHSFSGLKQFLYNRNREVYDFIDNYSELIKDYPFSHKLYWCINKIKDFPLCERCGNLNKRVVTIAGYEGNKKYCCHKCSVSSDGCKQKRKNTCLEKYGSDHPMKSEDVINKVKETCLRKYGETNCFKNKEVKEKVKKIVLEKYGVDRIGKSKIIRDKIHNTILEKYGVNYTFEIPEVRRKVSEIRKLISEDKERSESIKSKRYQTMIDKYGVPFALQNKDIQEKIKNTRLEKYGVEYIFQSKEMVEKSRLTRDEKYGSWSPKDFCDKVNKTSNERFGVDWYTKTDEFKDRYKNTSIKKYGVDNPVKSELVKEKIKNTCLAKYGCMYAQTDEYIEKCKKTNLERYGTEWSLNNKDVKNKAKQSLIKKYGVDNIFKSDVYRKKIILKRLTKTYFRLKQSSYLEPLFSLQEFLKSPHGKFKWKCKNCGEIIESFRSGCLKLEDPLYVRCEKCYPVHSHSIAEKQVMDIIKKYDPDCCSDKFFLGDGREIDVKSDKYKLCVEFDGLYWHSNKQLNFDKNYHLRKTELCESKKYQLIHIFEDEWEYKRDIVISRLKSIMGVYDRVIYARKCTIKEVSQDDSFSFLNENHLQGVCSGKIRLGLFQDNELISIMVFGDYRKALGRIKQENEYELLRFCNKLNCHVPGAASKLLKYFIKNYQPKKIISYCDRRWSVGKMYESIGFKKIRETEPNYWYVIGGHREHRYAWRKSILHKKLKKFDQNKTEYDNMLDNKIDCIYDCGNILYQLDFD